MRHLGLGILKKKKIVFEILWNGKKIIFFNNVKTMVQKKMENAYELSVDLKVDIETGKSWAEAKG